MEPADRPTGFSPSPVSIATASKEEVTAPASPVANTFIRQCERNDEDFEKYELEKEQA